VTAAHLWDNLKPIERQNNVWIAPPFDFAAALPGYQPPCLATGHDVRVRSSAGILAEARREKLLIPPGHNRRSAKSPPWLETKAMASP